MLEFVRVWNQAKAYQIYTVLCSVKNNFFIFNIPFPPPFDFDLEIRELSEEF